MIDHMDMGYKQMRMVKGMKALLPMEESMVLAYSLFQMELLRKRNT
jgi:hypothetical protein